MAYALQKARSDWLFRLRVNDVRLRVTENTMLLVNRLGLRVIRVIGGWFTRHRT